MNDLAKKLATAATKKGRSGGDVARTETAFRKPVSTRKFTFNIDEGVYQQLRKQAFEQERDMTAIINEILGAAFDEKHHGSSI
ncbi:hypothetical protein [Rothia sp. P4278]|uniref:hypothetical protein n=1 Tax=Rothia sp. P4278 TaxID=3402658 RepID=UPI003AE65664